MSLRKILIEERKKKNIRACRVAKFIGISVVALSRFENNHTDLKSEHIEKYAEYIGFDILLLLKPPEDKRSPMIKASEIISKAYGISITDAHQRLSDALKRK